MISFDKDKKKQTKTLIRLPEKTGYANQNLENQY